MILYIGPPDEGYFIRSIAKTKGQELEIIPSSPHIDTQINEILTYNPEYMIFAVSQYTDNIEEIADAITGCITAKQSKAIILAPGYDPESRIIRLLKAKGHLYYILAGDSGSQKEELERCLAGFYKEREVEVSPEDKEKETKKINSKKIGITGSCSRMGTTTQALQLVKYLQLKGYKACYFEVNANHYVETLAEFYESAHDEYLGKVTFAKVDMYYKQEHLPVILQQEYDYFIFDFGCYSDTDFNKTSFLEKDLRIFCMGTKADEMPYTQAVLMNEFYKDVLYIYSFTSNQDQEDIIDLMEDRAQNTFFASWAPDPFILASPEIYEKILPVESVSTEETKKKKRGFFSRKRNAG